MDIPANATRKDKFWFYLVYGLGSLQIFILDNLVEEPYWRSKDGKVRPLRSLDDRYLLNIEALLKRRGDQDKGIYKRVNHELWRRGIPPETSVKGHRRRRRKEKAASR